MAGSCSMAPRQRLEEWGYFCGVPQPHVPHHHSCPFTLEPPASAVGGEDKGPDAQVCIQGLHPWQENGKGMWGPGKNGG